MPTEWVSYLPQLTAVVEKLGVVGLLIAAVAWLIWERVRLMRQGRRTFGQRDCARLVSERYRAALVSHKIDLPDTSDILKQYEQELREET